MEQGRRDFIKTAGAFALPLIATGRVWGQDIPSNDITIGLVGCGGIANPHLTSLFATKGCRVVAVCDVDRNHLDWAAERVNTAYENKDCVKYHDFRELNRDPKIDAVLVCTPDHWHALIAIDALRNGKHVYVEKPVTLTLREGQALAKVAAEKGLVTQTGTQQRSSKNFQKVANLLRNNRLGQLSRIDILIPPDSRICPGIYQTEPVPETLDWNFWLGPAPLRPFTRQGCHYNFRFISDYARGQITNWGSHYVDIAQWALDMDQSGPVEISGSGSFPTSGLFNNAQRIDVEVRYPNGLPMTIRSGGDPDDGSICFQGERGWIWLSRSRTLASDPKLLSEPLPKDAKTVLLSRDHHDNFLDAIRGNTKTVSDVAVGHRTNTVCTLADIAMHVGRKLKWDPKTESFADNVLVATRMLGRAMRGPWALV